MIKVLVVDDSSIGQELMIYILNSDKDIKVIGVANNGKNAIKFIQKNKPDIITINMQKFDEFEITRNIMETNPVPILIADDIDEYSKGNKAIKSGAVSIIERPVKVSDYNFGRISKNIINTVKLMSEVKVIKRKKYNKDKVGDLSESVKLKNSLLKIIAIGVSTGGPPVLQSIFSKLPPNVKVPIVVVQHIAPGFLTGFIDWLSKTTVYPIHIAKQGEKLLNGNIYFAPDGFHMEISKSGNIFLNHSERENGLRPSVSHLFTSVANYYGKNSMAILLTGMGKDGAKELKLLKDKGAITVAQNKESSVVYGMPGEAVKLNAAMYILSPEKIVRLIEKLSK